MTHDIGRASSLDRVPGLRLRISLWKYGWSKCVKQVSLSIEKKSPAVEIRHLDRTERVR